MSMHVVQKGETLWQISKNYDVDFEQLKNLNNHLSHPEMLLPGMKIKVPEKVTLTKAKQKEKPTPYPIVPKLHEDDEKKEPQYMEPIPHSPKPTPNSSPLKNDKLPPMQPEYPMIPPGLTKEQMTQHSIHVPKLPASPIIPHHGGHPYPYQKGCYPYNQMPQAPMPYPNPFYCQPKVNNMHSHPMHNYKPMPLFPHPIHPMKQWGAVGPKNPPASGGCGCNR